MASIQQFDEMQAAFQRKLEDWFDSTDFSSGSDNEFIVGRETNGCAIAVFKNCSNEYSVVRVFCIRDKPQISVDLKSEDTKEVFDFLLNSKIIN